MLLDSLGQAFGHELDQLGDDPFVLQESWQNVPNFIHSEAGCEIELSSVQLTWRMDVESECMHVVAYTSQWAWACGKINEKFSFYKVVSNTDTSLPQHVSHFATVHSLWKNGTRLH